MIVWRNFIFAVLLLQLNWNMMVLSVSCGCNDCTTAILETLAGAYTCGARIEYLQSLGYTEEEACSQVSGIEFRYICGPACDPARCDQTPSPVTPAPTLPPSPVSADLYCFPAEGERISFSWPDSLYKVEVKDGQGDVCGPGGNRFTSNRVHMNNDELVLQFKKVGNNWESSEVRIVMADGSKFDYGKYEFSIKSVEVIDSISTQVASNLLPKELVLGLFTWDPTEDYSLHQNYNHEVDIEISRWNSDTNADIQFLIQPPGSPQMHRFYSGGNDFSYDQGNHVHSFTWLPGEISWMSTSGGGQSHVYTTESAVLQGRPDLVQCLPANVEVRINLWNSIGNVKPEILLDDEYVEVTLDRFTYSPSSETNFIPNGGYCSKHCQCEAVQGCVNGVCVAGQGDPTSSPISSSSSPTAAPNVSPSNIPTRIPTSSLIMPSVSPSKRPTNMPSPSPTKVPSASPSKRPTRMPSPSPTKTPTSTPSNNPTKSPVPPSTAAPTSFPTPASYKLCRTVNANKKINNCIKIPGCYWCSTCSVASGKCRPKTPAPTASPSSKPTRLPSELPSVSIVAAVSRAVKVELDVTCPFDESIVGNQLTLEVSHAIESDGANVQVTLLSLSDASCSRRRALQSSEVEAVIELKIAIRDPSVVDTYSNDFIENAIIGISSAGFFSVVSSDFIAMPSAVPSASPSSRPTPLTAAPTASPTTGSTPSLWLRCRTVNAMKKRNNCIKISGCIWINNSCYHVNSRGTGNIGAPTSSTPVSAPVSPPTGSNSCSSISIKNVCKANGSCTWKNNRCISK